MKRLTTQEFIEKAKKVHGDKYNYDESIYVKTHEKLKVKCKTHGEFWIDPANHISRKIGCYKCGNSYKSNIEDFITKSNVIYDNQYDYENVVYVDKNTAVIIECPTHGSFSQTPKEHFKGNGCKRCNRSVHINNLFSKFMEDANKIHDGKYDYSKSVYLNSNKNIIIGCPIHGQFVQRVDHHVSGHGCRKCYTDRMSIAQKSDKDEFIYKSNLKHNFLYNYDESIYVDSLSKIKIMCKNHGYFMQTPGNHIQGKGCPKCVHKVSKPEIEVQDFVKSLGYEIETNNRKILKGKELDIFIPSLNKAIEFNGSYFHYSDKYFKPGKHGNKSNLCREKDIKLLHIREDLWKKDREKLERVIKIFLNFD